MPNAFESPKLLTLTALIISSYVSKNRISATTLRTTIQGVYRSLSTAGAVVQVQKREPAVPVRRSVEGDHIICLEDGLKFKMLKKHLSVSYGMTPEEYKRKWDLPYDYPMVAPNHTTKRSKPSRKPMPETGRRDFGSGHEIRAMDKDEQPETALGPMVKRLPARRAKGSRG